MILSNFFLNTLFTLMVKYGQPLSLKLRKWSRLLFSVQRPSDIPFAALDLSTHGYPTFYVFAYK